MVEAAGRNVKRLSQRRRKALTGLTFAALPLGVYAAVVLIPLLRSVNYSFYKWNGVSDATWVGLDNYVRFFTDPVLVSSLAHVLVFIVFFSLFPTALGLITAGLLARSRQPGMAVYR